MPEVDLKPDAYRVQTPSGRWLSRDDWRIAMPYAVIVALGFVAFAWWHRAELPLAVLVGTVGVSCLLLGIAIGAWSKRFD